MKLALQTLSSIRQHSGGYDTGAQTAIADVDGDGYDDLLIGVESIDGETNGGSNNGAIFVKKGGALPASSTEILLYNWSPSNHLFDYEIHGASNSMNLANVFTGDLDGDGYQDMLVRGTTISAADLYIVWGRPASGSAGLDWADDPYISVSSTNLRISSVGGIGNTVSNFVAIKDVDADGKADLLVGEPAYSSNRGRACLFLGRSQAAWTSLADGTGAISLASANLCMVGKTANDFLGRSVAIGNFDGLGRPEIFAAIPEGDGLNDAGSNTGEVGILWWDLPTNYSNLTFDVSPEF